jgi:hypothetical protein
MPGKYLHYAKLLKHTKAFIDETIVVKKQLTIGNLSRSETSCWENARERFEVAVYNTAPYFTQREFDVVWLILCDENLDTDETIMALQEFKEMLEQDIKSNLRGDDTEV